MYNIARVNAIICLSQYLLSKEGSSMNKKQSGLVLRKDIYEILKILKSLEPSQKNEIITAINELRNSQNHKKNTNFQ